MKKILYYVTDHGKGHATRSIAIIQEILKRNIEVTVRNTNAIEFFKQTLNVGILLRCWGVNTWYNIQQEVVPLE